jgi:Tfp pilus assembly protein PilN
MLQSIGVSIQSRLSRATSFVGVEIFQREDATVAYNLVELIRKKDSIAVTRSLSNLTHEDLIKSLNVEIPIYVTVNNRSVLNRVLPNNLSDSNSDLIKAVFPNAKADDFYIQRESFESGLILSVIRREVLDTLIKSFIEQNFWILGISLASFDIKHIASLLNTQHPIPTQTQVLTYNKQSELIDFAQNTEGVSIEMKLGDDVLNSHLLTAYTGAFKGLLQMPSTFSIPLIEELKGEYIQKNLFKSGGLAALVTLLIVLLLSTFLNDGYKDKNNAIQVQLLSQGTELSALDSLKSQYTHQKAFVAQTNINQSSKTSFYADRLAVSLPDGLEFTSVDINPMMGSKKEYREGQLVKYEKEVITVKGVSHNSIVYNEWIKKLQTLEWVKTVKHIDYKDLTIELGEFELKIFIKI